MELIKQNCEDVRMDDEPLFLDEFFKDKCGEETRVENLKSRVLFEKRKTQFEYLHV